LEAVKKDYSNPPKVLGVLSHMLPRIKRVEASPCSFWATGKESAKGLE